jgi:hypothetical protein
MTTKAIPCRVCGLATDLNPETFYGHTPSGQRDPASDFTIGTCSECLTLDTVAPGSAVRACLRLLGKDGADWPMFATALQDMEIDAAAVMFEATGHPRRGPQAKAFAHVPKEVRAELRRAWAKVLEAKVAATLPAPEPEPEGPPADAPQGCLACGVATAVEWHGPLHTFGLTRGPERVDGYVCPECSVALEQVGAVGMDFLERAVMSAKSLDFAPRVRAWVATGLPPTSEPWSWLDLQEPPLTLDPITFLQMQVSELTDELASLRSEVDALRRVPVP